MCSIISILEEGHKPYISQKEIKLKENELPKVTQEFVPRSLWPSSHHNILTLPLKVNENDEKE